MGDNYRRKQNEKKRICPSGGFNISNASVPRDQHFKHQYPYVRAAKTSGAENRNRAEVQSKNQHDDIGGNGTDHRFGIFDRSGKSPVGTGREI